MYQGQRSQNYGRSAANNRDSMAEVLAHSLRLFLHALVPRLAGEEKQKCFRRAAK